MAMCVQCEDCKFANWDATLFRDHEDGRWEGGHYIPPYNEQYDAMILYSTKVGQRLELEKKGE